ncbi:hypothetical protein LINPERPRIM_LOCUS44488 [Linum perenne]
MSITLAYELGIKLHPNYLVAELFDKFVKNSKPTVFVGVLCVTSLMDFYDCWDILYGGKTNVTWMSMEPIGKSILARRRVYDLLAPSVPAFADAEKSYPGRHVDLDTIPSELVTPSYIERL